MAALGSNRLQGRRFSQWASKTGTEIAKLFEGQADLRLVWPSPWYDAEKHAVMPSSDGFRVERGWHGPALGRVRLPEQCTACLADVAKATSCYQGGTNLPHSHGRERLGAPDWVATARNCFAISMRAACKNQTGPACMISPSEEKASHPCRAVFPLHKARRWASCELDLQSKTANAQQESGVSGPLCTLQATSLPMPRGE